MSLLIGKTKRFRKGRFDVELVRSKHGWIWFDMWWTGRWNLEINISSPHNAKSNFSIWRNKSSSTLVCIGNIRSFNFYFDFGYNLRKKIHKC